MRTSIEMDVQGQSYPEYSLSIALTNKSEGPLTVYRHSLAWIGWHSIVLVAVKEDAVGTLLEKNTLIDDAGPSMLTIKSGETLAGKISLVERFPNFLEALEERNVIVFWSYNLQPVDASPSETAGGFVHFSKT